MFYTEVVLINGTDIVTMKVLVITVALAAAIGLGMPGHQVSAYEGALAYGLSPDPPPSPPDSPNPPPPPPPPDRTV